MPDSEWINLGGYELVPEDHCVHPARASYEDDWDNEDDYCVHCECCCTCLGCEYGPQDGMPLNYSAKAGGPDVA